MLRNVVVLREIVVSMAIVVGIEFRSGPMSSSFVEQSCWNIKIAEKVREMSQISLGTSHGGKR